MEGQLETTLILIKDLQMRLKQKESDLEKLQTKYEVSIKLISKERMKNQYLQSLIDSRKETDSEILDEIETAMKEDDIIVSNNTKKNHLEEKVKPIFRKPNVENCNFIEEICIDDDDDNNKADENCEMTGKDLKGVHAGNDDLLVEDISDIEEDDIGTEQVEFSHLESGDEDMSIDEDLNREDSILDEAITQELTSVEIEESKETHILQFDDIRLINSQDEQKMFTEKTRSENKILKAKKTRGCRKCEGCKFECLSCKFCLDKPKNGGRGTLRQACENKQCRNLI